MIVRPAVVMRAGRVRPAALAKGRRVAPGPCSTQLAPDVVWALGLEWDLDPSSPYHPLSGETGATFGLFTPLALGGKLRRWWDPWTLSLGSVSTWADRVAGVTVTQASEAARPTLVTGASGINGRPALYFDGADSLSKTDGATGLPTGTTARGLHAGYAPRRETGSNTLAQQGANSAGSRFAVQFRQTPIGDPYFTAWGADVSSGDAITLTAKFASAIWAGNAGLLRVFKNGTLKNSMARTINTGTDSLYIGSGPGGAEPMLGLLSDVVFTDGTETVEEIAKINAWWYWKFGRQALLAVDDPYRSTRPTQ